MPLDWKQRIANLLCHRSVGQALGHLYGDRIPLAGLRIATDAPVIAARTKAEIFWGIYESAELRFVQEHLRRDLDVVELGASIGGISSHVASRLEPGHRMVCVEANPALIPIIESNLSRHAPDLDVRLLNGAIDYSGREHVALELGATTVGSRVSRDAADPGAVEVPVMTLSGILQSQGFSRYALVSDIEGAEAGILFEDPAALDGCQQILIELHHTEHAGRPLAPEDLAREVSDRFGFRERARHGPVYVFERPGA